MYCTSRDSTLQSLYYCLFAPRICGCCSSRTSRSWWITRSTQRQRSGCNTTQWNIQAVCINYTVFRRKMTENFQFNWLPRAISSLWSFVHGFFIHEIISLHAFCTREIKSILLRDQEYSQNPSWRYVTTAVFFPRLTFTYICNKSCVQQA